MDKAKTTDGYTPLFVASRNGNIEVVELLLEAKADVNKAETNGYTPLIIASQNDHIEVVKLLLAAKADVDIKVKIDGKVYTALSVAKEKGYTHIVTLLKKQGA